MTHDTEDLRKKNKTEIQNTMEDYSGRLEQIEDRISELEDEMKIKGKTEELLCKQPRPVKGICNNSLTNQKTKPENHGH
jgi:hypothetical protein